MSRKIENENVSESIEYLFSHLKEGFEGYFQDLQPVTQSGSTTINLQALKVY